MSYPTEWWIQDRINAATRGMVKDFQLESVNQDIHSLSFDLDRAKDKITYLENELANFKYAMVDQLEFFRGQIEELSLSLHK